MLAAPLFSCSLNQPDLPRMISGIVLDKQTGKPLNGVKVSIEIKEKGGSGLGPEGLHSPKVIDTLSQITGEFDQNAFEFGKTGVYNFDFHQEYELKLSEGRTISKLIAEKEGYQTFTIKYPPEQLTIYLSSD